MMHDDPQGRMVDRDVLSEELEQPRGELTLGLLVGALWHGRRLIAVAVLLATAIAFLYLALFARPVYEATAIIGPPTSVNSKPVGRRGRGLVHARRRCGRHPAVGI